MFSRNVKFQVDIVPAHTEGGDGQKIHYVNFTLLTGNVISHSLHKYYYGMLIFFSGDLSNILAS